MPSVHRKCSSNGRWSGVDGGNTGDVHREVQEMFQGEGFRPVSKNKE